MTTNIKNNTNNSTNKNSICNPPASFAGRACWTALTNSLLPQAHCFHSPPHLRALDNFPSLPQPHTAFHKLPQPSNIGQLQTPTPFEHWTNSKAFHNLPQLSTPSTPLHPRSSGHVRFFGWLESKNPFHISNPSILPRLGILPILPILRPLEALEDPRHPWNPKFLESFHAWESPVCGISCFSFFPSWNPLLWNLWNPFNLGILPILETF